MVSTTHKLSETAASVLTQLILTKRPGGFTPPMSRAALAAAVGVSDRKLRRAVAELREAGWPIIADEVVGGYYYSDEPEDIRAQWQQHVSRIRALARTARRMERLLAELPPRGQQVLDLPGEEETS